MSHQPSVDQVKAEILNVFKTINEGEAAKQQKIAAERLRKARQRIENLREQKRLQEELSDGWDLELH